MTEILTIGHSNHDILDFLNILKKHGIRVLVDVRSDPYSRYAPQFNKSDFQRHVTAAGIEYRYSGSSIGGKPKDMDLYTPSGKPDYDKLAATDAFQNELKGLVEMARTKRIVIMCSEADPEGCHRERIIAQVLRSWGIEVVHIMPDGAVARVEQQGLF
ncbi:MAG: DUF488 domain-containing protein [Armatimonadetes bacterium]|nr:DUF488 domain-containing protein [Armatimonadota bacterium]